jgi:hypothetical protein
MAVDDGTAWRYEGATWAATNIDGTTSLNSVSCLGSSCVAVDNTGEASRYFAGWGTFATAKGGSPLLSVSCVSSTFCLTVSAEAEGTFNGVTWSGPTAIATGGGLVTSVSCATSSSCRAAQTLGAVSTFNGGTWVRQVIDAPHTLVSVSCPAGTTFCAAVDDAGNVLTSDNSAVWSTPASIDSGQALKSVSCPTASFCVAVDAAGNALTDDAGVWSAPVSIDPGHSLTSVSCPTASFCLAVDDAGNALTDPPSQAEMEEEAGRKSAEEAAAAKKRAEETAAKSASEQHAAGSPSAGAPGGSGAKEAGASLSKLGACEASTQKAFRHGKLKALRLHGDARAKALRAAQKKKHLGFAGCKRRYT